MQLNMFVPKKMGVYGHPVVTPLGPNLGTRYTCGKYSVTVAPDRTIKVKPHDWLTKYSYAIYGDYWTIWPFFRKYPSGRVVTIPHPHWIYAGETLYYMPELFGSVILAPPPSQIKKAELKIEHFKHEYPKEVSELVGWGALAGHAVTELAEAAEVVGRLSEEAGEAASGVGIILFAVHSVIDIVNSWKTGLRGIGMRAVAYGTVAWTFGDGPPPVPAYLGPQSSQQALQQALKVSDRMTGEYYKEAAKSDQYNASVRQNAWREGVGDAIQALSNFVRQERLDKAACQLAFQERGDGDPNKLLGLIMIELEKALPSEERLNFRQPEPWEYPSG